MIHGKCPVVQQGKIANMQSIALSRLFYITSMLPVVKDIRFLCRVRLCPSGIFFVLLSDVLHGKNRLYQSTYCYTAGMPL